MKEHLAERDLVFETITLLDATERERRELLAGGLFNNVKEGSHGGQA